MVCFSILSEFGREVARRLRVLRAEGRAEGVDIAESAGVGLCAQLARDGQKGLLAEKVGRVRMLAALSMHLTRERPYHCKPYP